MDPSNVQWTEESGGGVSTTLKITCKPDGSFHFSSGTAQADYSNESDAENGISQLLQYGSSEAQKS